MLRCCEGLYYSPAFAAPCSLLHRSQRFIAFTASKHVHPTPHPLSPSHPRTLLYPIIHHPPCWWLHQLLHCHTPLDHILHNPLCPSKRLCFSGRGVGNYTSHSCTQRCLKSYSGILHHTALVWAKAEPFSSKLIDDGVWFFAGDVISRHKEVECLFWWCGVGCVGHGVGGMGRGAG